MPARRRSCSLLTVQNLTTSQYVRVQNLVRRSPVFIGMRVVVNDSEVEVLEPEDLVLGLHPVVEAVAGAPPDEWPSLVDECLERMMRAVTDNSPELDGPTEQVLDRIYARLRPIDGSPTEWWRYAREVAPGLLIVLALDHPHHIAILNDEQVHRHGFDVLMAAGLDNLCGQLPETYATDDQVYILSGEEYVASTVLVIQWVVEVVTGDPEVPHGVLVATPDHTTLIFHVLRDGAGARHALGEMARLAADQHEAGRQPLSPHVHWWRPGSGYLEPVAHASADSGVIGSDLITQYPPDFAELLAELDRL